MPLISKKNMAVKFKLDLDFYRKSSSKLTVHPETSQP